MTREKFWGGLQLANRAAIGGALALLVAQRLHLEHPIYALISAVIVTDFKPSETQKLALRRVLATLVGAACGIALSFLLQPGAWQVAIGLFVAMAAAHVLHVDEGARIAGYTCALILLDYHENSFEYGVFRVIETVVGIAVAWAISFVPRLIRFEVPEKPPS